MLEAIFVTLNNSFISLLLLTSRSIGFSRPESGCSLSSVLNILFLLKERLYAFTIVNNAFISSANTSYLRLREKYTFFDLRPFRVVD